MQAAPTSNEPGYASGVCNIGLDEITVRRRAGHLGLAGAVALLIGLLVADASPVARLLVALPVAAAAIGYLQAYLRFCAAFGFRGVFNFGPLGTSQPIANPEAAARDRAKAIRISVAAALIGLATGVVLVFLPL